MNPLCKVLSTAMGDDNKYVPDGHVYTIYEDGTFNHSSWTRKTISYWKIEDNLFKWREAEHLNWLVDDEDGDHDDAELIRTIENALTEKYLLNEG